MRALRTILIALALSLAALSALAQTGPIIITWNTTGGQHTGDLAGTVTADGQGITQVALRRNVVIHEGAVDAYNSRNWGTGTTADLTRYLEWGFNTDRPYQLDNLRIRLRREAQGPGSFRIDMQLDTGAFVTVLTGELPNPNNDVWFATPLSSSQVVTQQVRFRLYAWNAGQARGTLQIANEDGLVGNHGIVIRSQFAATPANLEAQKDVIVFSEDGSLCDDLVAAPPAEPANPAAIPGACIQYTISVANTGSVAAENITLVDALPAHLTFVGAALSPTSWGTLATPDCPGSGCEVRINDGVIAANQTATVTIRATIN